MFFDDHKKAIYTMMAKRNSKGERTMNPTGMRPEESHTEDGQADGLHLAAQDIIAAHRDNSADAVKQALSNFINIHQSMRREFDGGDSADKQDE